MTLYYIPVGTKGEEYRDGGWHPYTVETKITLLKEQVTTTTPFDGVTMHVKLEDQLLRFNRTKILPLYPPLPPPKPPKPLPHKSPEEVSRENWLYQMTADGCLPADQHHLIAYGALQRIASALEAIAPALARIANNTRLRAPKSVPTPDPLDERRAREKASRDRAMALYLRARTGAYANVPVADLVWSARVRRVCARLGVETVGELCEKSAGDLLEVRNCGAETVAMIRAKLAEIGLSLRDDHPLPSEDQT